MPLLLLVNGPPGVGKSTVARRYADDHPLTLDLELDTIRGLLGSWLEAPDQSGLAARRLALAMARAHLESGGDVVVPQLLRRREFVDELRALADAALVRAVASLERGTTEVRVESADRQWRRQTRSR